MPQSRGKYEFYQEASLSQKLAFKIKRYEKQIYPILAGSDPAVSMKIGRLLVLRNNGMLDNLSEFDYELMLQLLDMERLAKFATSKKINEITAMGLQFPKEDPSYGEDKKSEA